VALFSNGTIGPVLGRRQQGQRLRPDRAVLECRVTDADDGCRSCGGRGRPLGTDSRTLAHEPFGGRPTTLLVRVRRYRCTVCGRFWSQDTSAVAEPRAKVSRSGLAWALRALAEFVKPNEASVSLRS